jgi:cyclase
MIKKILKWLGVAVLALILVAGTLYVIYLRPFMQRMAITHVQKVDDGLTLVLGGGGNSGIFTSDSVVVVVDSKMDEAAKKLADTVKLLAGARPIIVINTHWHRDHSSGNQYYPGQTVLAGANYTCEAFAEEAGKENIPNKSVKDRMNIRMGDDTITVINLAKNVHTPSDVFVYSHKRKMLFGGDVILNKQAPAILGSADPDAYIATLEWVPTAFAIETVVPGHGPVGGKEVIDNFRIFFNDMKMAAEDDSKRDALEKKYEDWAQVPGVMSPGSTIRAFKNKKK